MPGRGTIRFSHDGRTFFTWGSPVIQAWDRDTGRERYAVRHARDCWVCAESPDGKTLATAGIDSKLCLWDAANGHELLSPIEHPNQVLSVAFSPDGRMVGTACLDWQTRVWEVSTGKLLHAMSPGGWLTDLRFTPDGHFTVNAGASGVQVWDTKTGHPVSQRFATGTGDLPQLDISQDGRWTVIAAAGSFFSVIDLQMLTGEVGGTPEDALLWTELLSNARIAGSSVVNLSDAEWLARWKEYRRHHPEFHPMQEN
jgi:WD40 repeat protein